MPGADFYTDMDERCAAARLRRCILFVAALLVPLAAIYVLAVLNAMRWLMLAALVLAFAATLFCGDVWLVPALRYKRFLVEMRSGLRRSTDCILERMDSEPQKQDGVFVYALHVRICESGDSRIFYVNTSKAGLLPGMGSRVRLVSFGRHAVGFETC